MLKKIIKENYCNFEFDSESMCERSIHSKTAAMFGLDARIALAIFGALSVITGAALFSAIKDAKATALISRIDEIAKAWEQYYLDTGIELPAVKDIESRSYKSYYNSQELIDNTSNIKGWQGPYLSMQKEAVHNVRQNKTVFAMLKLTKDLVWGDTVNWNDAGGGGLCTSGTSCAVWVIVGGFKNTDTFVAVDKKIDGGDGATAGSVRWKIGTNDPWYNQMFIEKYPTKM